jgi:homoserine dehydrogenase
VKSVNIGICGLGTVGGGTLNVLRDSAELITARAAAQLRVIHVGARHDSPSCDLAGVRVSRDIFEVARDPQHRQWWLI